MIIGLLSFSIFVSAVFSVFFRMNGQKTLFAVFKPLTTILIIIMAFVIYRQNDSTYMLIILSSLFFALIGDVFLIGRKGFLFGLIFFLLAHIGFTFAFANLHGFQWNVLPLLILIPIGILFFNYLRKDLKDFILPVGIYFAFIILMNWQAMALFLLTPSIVLFGIALGSLLFSFSDAIIAINKFKKQFTIAELLILMSYWLAIYLFVIAGLYSL